MEKHYSPKEIVDQGLLGVKERKLREIIKSGAISFVNISTGSKRPTYRISQSAIDEFLAKNTTETVDTPLSN